MARRWLEKLRKHTDKPVRYLVLSIITPCACSGRGVRREEIVASAETSGSSVNVGRRTGTSSSPYAAAVRWI